MIKLAAAALLCAASTWFAPTARADDPLATATREVCGMGGRSGNPFQLFNEKLSLEQRFGLTDQQAVSLMWQAINTSCP
jgi:hypothetical protein